MSSERSREPSTPGPLRRALDTAGGDPARLLALVVAVLAGVVVFLVATQLFPYHSVNDDEGVYLLQATMLLDGQLFLRPPAELAALVRPWFFVVGETGEGVRMYAKYAPVPAATFALGTALGEPRLSLALVAAGNAWLVYALTRETFDRTTGVVAAGCLVSAPLFVVSSSVFLPYASTTLWNLLFAFAYLRARRRDSTWWALLAGVAVGVAFFSRPYTALLFAAPFVVHTLWRLGRAWRRRGDGESETAGSATLRRELGRAVATAVPGVAFVGVTLAYNAALTGSPLVFPYEAFAPRDGIGFGRREILGYTETYTLALGVESTVEALDLYVSRWGPLGPLGAVLALAGVAAAFAPSGTARDASIPAVTDATDRELAGVLVCVAPSVVVGNVYFWGTLNGLRNGLIELLGPFYHFDLLVPTAVFAAVGAVALWRRVRATVSERLSRRSARVVLALLLVVSAPVVVGVERSAFAEPVTENRDRTEALASAYEPFSTTAFENAIVFTPDPYGDWQQHPFQYLRNDPGFGGSQLYVIDEGPDADWRALDATSRTPYRFTYRGEWGPPNEVTGELQRLTVHRGERVETTTTVGVPAGSTAASVRLETPDGSARYAVRTVDERMRIEWTVDEEGAAVSSLPLAFGPERLPVEGETEVDLVVTFVDRSGASVSYRQELTVDTSGERLRAVGPPETRICRLRTECGMEGTWIGEEGTYLPGVDVSTTVRAVDE